MSNLILTSFVVMATIAAFITLHSAFTLASVKRSVVTWIYPVIAAVAIVLAAKGVIEIQGYPINAKPAGQWEYLTHYDEGVSVLVLVKESGEARAYRFVPSSQEKKEMQKAKEAKDKGKRPLLQMDNPIPKMELIRLDQEFPK